MIRNRVIYRAQKDTLLNKDQCKGYSRLLKFIKRCACEADTHSTDETTSRGEVLMRTQLLIRRVRQET